MFQAIRSKGRLPFKYLVADCLYGNSPDFLDAVDSCIGVTSLVSIPADTRCWLQRPLTTEKTYTYRGEVRAKRMVAAETQAPGTVETLAQSLASSCWYRRTVSEGTEGPIAYAFASKRVTLSKEGLTDRTGWLVIKRTLGSSPTYSYYLSNAPASTPLRLFVWLSGVRWAIEQGFEETKTARGMAHEEGRKYPGWHHHILTCMFAHFFLWHLQIRLGKKAPALTVSQVRTLLVVILPLRTYTVPEALALVAWVQRCNHRAYLSHRKRREMGGEIARIS